MRTLQYAVKAYRLHGVDVSFEVIREYVLNYFKSDVDVRGGRYDFLLNQIPPRSTVLDYGCGWGCFSKQMADAGHAVLGIDLSADEINICRDVWSDSSENPTFKNASIDELSPNSFDVVVSCVVIEHTHNPGTYLHQINRVLKPGGLLLIALPNIMNPRFYLPLASPRYPEYLKRVSKRVLSGYDKSALHIQAWDPTHFTHLVSTVGFLLQQYMPLEGIPLPSLPWVPRMLKSRWINRLFFFSNYSYTMAFVFKKMRDSVIAPFD